ncbi:MAG: GntR family transcriptional regulator [Desulfobacterales bacterium]|jgi:DNA-binding GntR family transcriptional regulator
MAIRKRKSINHKRKQIFDTLRERIIGGYYSPGVKLIEQDLSQEFNTSRPMLREIFSSLENLGLVEKFANRGTSVRRINSRSLLEIMEIREVLEGLAARLAAQNSQPEDWQDLAEEFGEPFEQIVKNAEFEKYLDLISTFRERTVAAARSEELSKLIFSMYAKIQIVQRRIIILPGRIQQAIVEHREVLNAIIDGDPDKAEKMKRLNMRTAREWLEKYKKWVL